MNNGYEKRAIRLLREEGVQGFVDALKRRISPRMEKKLFAVTVTHNEAMEWFRRRRDTYERLISAILPYVDQRATIFDIGANIGYFTLILHRRLSFKGAVYLFEPVPHLAELSKITFDGMPFAAKVFNFGLSDQNAEDDIYMAGDGNLGWNTLLSQQATPDMEKVRIQLKSFDTSGIDVKPSFIKVDVEGAEFKVFRGMLKSFRKWHPLPVILCEVAWGRCHPAWDEELSVFEEMKEIGYNTFDLDKNPVIVSGLAETTDIILMPRDKII